MAELSKILTLTKTIKITSANNNAGCYLDLSILRKVMLLFLFINFFTVGYNQVIKGVILDKETKSTVPHATVYFSGTFVGTTSDQHGNFKIDITEYASRPLAISAIGYYSFTLTDFSHVTNVSGDLNNFLNLSTTFQLRMEEEKVSGCVR